VNDGRETDNPRKHSATGRCLAVAPMTNAFLSDITTSISASGVPRLRSTPPCSHHGLSSSARPRGHCFLGRCARFTRGAFR